MIITTGAAAGIRIGATTGVMTGTGEGLGGGGSTAAGQARRSLTAG